MPAAAPAASSVFPLRGGDADDLSKQRTQRPTRGNDRSFGAERTARTDRDRGRERFQERDPRGDATFIREDLLHRFGNAVAANCPRAVAGHEADHHRTHDRHHDHQQPEPVVCRTGFHKGDLLKKCDVRDHRDQPHEHDRRRGGCHAQQHRERRNQQDAAIDERRFGRHMRCFDDEIQRRRNCQSVGGCRAGRDLEKIVVGHGWRRELRREGWARDFNLSK
jgi:hypothetical protein